MLFGSMDIVMQRAQGVAGARCRQLAVPGLPHQAQVHSRRCVAHAGRERGRDGHSRSSSIGQGAAAPSAWLLPTSLVSERRAKDAPPVADPDAPLTVYTIRLTTGVTRGSALSDPNAAVNVCLIGAGGRAALHRISPVNDPLESRAHALEMCQLITPDVGADCTLALADAAAAAAAAVSDGASNNPSPPTGKQQQQQQQQQRPAAGAPISSGGPPTRGPVTSPSASTSSLFGSPSGGSLVGRPPPPPPPKRRFQEGSVDEVSVLVPELGPLAGVLVGVEAGTWYLDEMDVASSRTQHMDRFVCRRQLGGQVGEGAALLTPVPVGSVVYGEGEAAVVLTKDQAAALWSLNMSDYSDLKRRIAATTALLVASGASLAALTGGTAAALPYTAGGVVGLVYQWLLMRGVDHVVEAATTHPTTAPTATTTSGSQPSSPASSEQLAQQQRQQQQTSATMGSSRSSNGSGSNRSGSSPSLSPAGGRVLGSAPLRLGFVCASAALGLALLSREEAGVLPDGGSVSPLDSYSYGGAAAWQLALGVLGFLTYKAALVGVSLGGERGGGARGPLGGLVLGRVSKVLQSSEGGGSRTELEKYKRD